MSVEYNIFSGKINRIVFSYVCQNTEHYRGQDKAGTCPECGEELRPVIVENENLSDEKRDSTVQEVLGKFQERPDTVSDAEYHLLDLCRDLSAWKQRLRNILPGPKPCATAGLPDTITASNRVAPKAGIAPHGPAPRKIPHLTQQAEFLLLLAREGREDLGQWVGRLALAWNELDIITNPTKKKLVVWVCTDGKLIQVSDLHSGYMPGPFKTYTSGPDGDCEKAFDWECYTFARDSMDLKECFFRVFPGIDAVDTAKVSGLGFENPFRRLGDHLRALVHGQPTMLDANEFCEDANKCERSKAFREAWENVKAAAGVAPEVTAAPGKEPGPDFDSLPKMLEWLEEKHRVIITIHTLRKRFKKTGKTAAAFRIKKGNHPLHVPYSVLRVIIPEIAKARKI